jgi:hypothetical protein
VLASLAKPGQASHVKRVQLKTLTLYGHFRESANSTEFEELKHGRNIRAIQFAAME